MKISILGGVFLVMVEATLVTSHPEDSSFYQLVCEHCSSWRSVEQRSIDTPRVGKAGPRGIAGPPGPPGLVNLTAIKLLINREIGKVVASLTRTSCENIDLDLAKTRNETGGIFDLLIPTNVGLSEIYCDVATDGGNWIVFQRRLDGSVDFFRNWNEYVNGFGNPRGEYWLGLDAIHELTKLGDQELRIDMITKDGRYFTAQYSTFSISSGIDNYRLSVSDYAGNAADSLTNPGESWATHHHQQFSTKDKDRDSHSSNCAFEYKGGWWYNACHRSNLNGFYNEANHPSGIAWFHHGSKGFMYMAFTEMKFRTKK